MGILSDLLQGTSHSVSYLRELSIERTLSIHGIRIRRLFAPLFRLVYATQTDYRIIIDSREKLPKSKLGRIFALNHRQAVDIVIGANAVAQSGYIVFGNPHLAFETTNGLGLWAYGMILLNRDNPSSRKATYAKMKYIIEHGGNIIIYPESYWNLDDDGEADATHDADGHNSENWLIQDINIGILRLAKETGCEIVPTVLHYDEHGKKRCYAMRGKPFRVVADEDAVEKKNQLVEIMQGMKFTLMEKYSTYKRATLEQAGVPLRVQWEQLKEELINDCDIPRIGYHLDLVDEKKIGKAKVMKPVATQQEAFAHLGRLTPCRENAFLFSKRLGG